MSIDSKRKQRSEEISGRRYLTYYQGMQSMEYRGAKDFYLDISPTLIQKENSDGSREKLWTYILLDREGNPVISGSYPHSAWKFFEKRNLKRTIKEKLNYKLHPDLVSDIVDVHFLLREDASHLEAASEEV